MKNENKIFICSLSGKSIILNCRPADNDQGRQSRGLCGSQPQDFWQGVVGGREILLHDIMYRKVGLCSKVVTFEEK